MGKSKNTSTAASVTPAEFVDATPFVTAIRRYITCATPLIRVDAADYDAVKRELKPLFAALDANVILLRAHDGRSLFFPAQEANAAPVVQKIIRPDDKKAANPFMQTGSAQASLTDTLAALETLDSKNRTADLDNLTIILLVSDMQLMEKAPAAISALRAFRERISSLTICVIGLVPPGVMPPIELQNEYVYVNWEMPTVDSLYEYLVTTTSIATDEDSESGSSGQTMLERYGEEKVRMIAEAGKGLTLHHFSTAVTSRLTDDADELDHAAVWQFKQSVLNKSGFLTTSRPTRKEGHSFDSLEGMEGLKAFCREAISNWHRRECVSPPKGVIMFGAPGIGKTAFGRALGGEMDLPVVHIDLGKLFGGLVGDTERNTRLMIQTIEAMAPCIGILDELEKTVPSRFSGQLDSGVSTRMLGAILTWLSERQNDVFVVGCANELDGVHEALLRAERFDGVYYVDTPDQAQRAAIWKMYRQMYRIPADSKTPESEGWTGAEIKSCCRLADLRKLPLEVAARQVVPILRQKPELFEALRDAAHGRFLSAGTGFVYDKDEESRARDLATATQPGKRKVRCS